MNTDVYLDGNAIQPVNPEETPALEQNIIMLQSIQG